jgi:biotin carboxyl carrier protein
MDYKIADVEKSFEGKIIENLGNNDYVIKINDKEHQLRIINMDAKGIEFVLDQQFHKAKYLEAATSEMNLVIDHVPITLNKNTHFNEVVFKNSGGGGSGGTQLALKSQIPGKVVSIAVAEGDSVVQSKTSKLKKVQLLLKVT